MSQAVSGTDPASEQLGGGSLHSRSQRAWEDAQAAWARAQAIQARQEEAARGSTREPRTVPLSARLEAQLASMPVIEQAKGVLMARQGCDADQASDLLRRAAQRSNMPIRELAAQIVKKAQQREASA